MTTAQSLILKYRNDYLQHKQQMAQRRLLLGGAALLGISALLIVRRGRK